MAVNFNVQFETNNSGFNARLSELNANFGTGFGDVIKGDEGDSAYEVAVQNGFVGDEDEWLASLTGASGATFTPSVDAAGNLSWTNDGGLENPETVNIKGTVDEALSNTDIENILKGFV